MGAFVGLAVGLVVLTSTLDGLCVGLDVVAITEEGLLGPVVVGAVGLASVGADVLF